MKKATNVSVRICSWLTDFVKFVIVKTTPIPEEVLNYVRILHSYSLNIVNPKRQEKIGKLTPKNEVFSLKSMGKELVETGVKPVTQKQWKERKRYVDNDSIQLLTVIEIADKPKKKVWFNLLDNALTMIGKIVKKQGFECIKRGNYYSFLLRLIDPSAIEEGYHTLEIFEMVKNKIKFNNQIIRYKTDHRNTMQDACLLFFRSNPP
jgi:hypothetical protein